MDFRKNLAPPASIILCGSPVDSVESCCFLGTIITQDLKWELNIRSLTRDPADSDHHTLVSLFILFIYYCHCLFTVYCLQFMNLIHQDQFLAGEKYFLVINLFLILILSVVVGWQAAHCG